MKFFQPFFVVFLFILVSALAQEEQPPQPNCDAICNERVQQAVQPISDEKKRTEEWGWGLHRELEEMKNKLAQAQGEAQTLRNQVAEHERAATEARTSLESAQRELEAAKREIGEVKQSTSAEIEELRTKAEEATQSLGRVQFALDTANDQIKEMESARFTVNFKGIQEDVKSYWKNLLTWWTGLVMPEKKVKDEDL